jgi:hypothetical protein
MGYGPFAARLSKFNMTTYPHIHVVALQALAPKMGGKPKKEKEKEFRQVL